MKNATPNKPQDKRFVNNLNTDGSAASSEEKKATMNTEPKNGIVKGCDLLNIRQAPTKDSAVIITVNEGTKFVIDMNLSQAEYYKVRTLSDLSGYALKKFIAIQ